MKRKFIGFFAGLMASSECPIHSESSSSPTTRSVPVVRAADDAKPGTGEISISEDDPCLVIGHGTKFTSEFTPKMQIMLPKSVGSSVAEVVEILSDTQLKIRKEFSGSAKIREKLSEAQAAGQQGLAYKRLPFVDQHEMYHHVYQCLTEGGAICIFPEGMCTHPSLDLISAVVIRV